MSSSLGQCKWSQSESAAPSHSRGVRIDGPHVDGGTSSAAAASSVSGYDKRKHRRPQKSPRRAAGPNCCRIHRLVAMAAVGAPAGCAALLQHLPRSSATAQHLCREQPAAVGQNRSDGGRAHSTDVWGCISRSVVRGSGKTSFKFKCRVFVQSSLRIYECCHLQRSVTGSVDSVGTNWRL